MLVEPPAPFALLDLEDSYMALVDEDHVGVSSSGEMNIAISAAVETSQGHSTITDVSASMEVDVSSFPPLKHSTLPSDCWITNHLSACGLQVDPTYRLTICMQCHAVIDYSHAYSHLLSKHKPPLHSKNKFPTRETLTKMLVKLNAHQVRSVFPGPISPIGGLYWSTL